MLDDVMLILQAVRLSLRRESEESVDFLTSIVHFALQLGVTVVYWLALTRGLGPLGDWDIRHLLVMSSLANLAPVVDIFSVGFRDLPTSVQSGSLDKYLCKPCNPIIAMLSESLYIRYPLYQALTSLVLLAWGYAKLDLLFSSRAVVESMMVFVCGVYAVRFVRGVVALLVFWFGRVDGIRMITAAIGSLSSHPVVFYAPPLQKILTYYLPYGLIATYPTMILMGWRPRPTFLLSVLLSLGMWWLLFAATWRAALRRYESFGG